MGELLRCRRELIRMKKEKLDEKQMRSFLKNNVNVQVKDTGGNIRDIKSVNVIRHGKFWWSPTIEIILTDKHE